MTSKGQRIGYVRVSTIEQNPGRQLEGVEVDRKFIDYASARSIDRPQLNAMLNFVREDDIILVHSMDRLARNLKHLKLLIDGFLRNKIQVHFIKEGLKFGSEESPFSNLMLHMLGSFAQFEYEFMRERQREGISLAKKRGTYKGRVKLSDEKIEILKKEIYTNKLRKDIAKDLGISRMCMYSYIRKLGLEEACPRM